MKTLYLLFAVVFLAFQIQAQPDVKTALYQVDACRPVDESALSHGKHRIRCFGQRGYCFLRQYKCDSGFVFMEEFNDCRNNRTLKCCVPPRIGLGGRVPHTE